MAVISKVPIIMGLLPTLSEYLPIIGLKTNCINEKAATITPISKSDIYNSLLANVGRIGINNPNPSKSMNTVIKIIVNEAFVFI